MFFRFLISKYLLLTFTCHLQFGCFYTLPSAYPALLSAAQVFDASLDTKHRSSFHFSGSGSTVLGKRSLNDFTLRSQPPFLTIKALCTVVLFWECPSRNTKAFHVGNCTLTVLKQELLVQIKQAKEASGYHFPAPLSLFCGFCSAKLSSILLEQAAAQGDFSYES